MRGVIKSEQPNHQKAKILTHKAYKYAITAYDVVFIYIYSDQTKNWDLNIKSEQDFDKAATIISQLYPKPKGKKGKAIMLKMNYNDNKTLCRYFDIWGCPSHRLIKNGQYMEYVPFYLQHNTESFLQFIEEFIDNKIERNPLELVNKTKIFKTELLPQKDFMNVINCCDYALIMFYVHWKQESKLALELYENFALELEKYLQGKDKSSLRGLKDSVGNLRLFRLNCTYISKYVESLNIQRYPAFKLYKNGEYLIEYKWNKDVDGLLEFVKHYVKSE